MTSEPTTDLATADRCFEHLVVIDDPDPRTGPVNMAFDELLLAGEKDGPPRLRFYRWAEPTVSFGYFEPAAAARRLAGSQPVVRRPTGGGLVEHGDDLTYTLVVPRSEPFVRLRPAESYRLIHAAVASALASGGRQSFSHPEPAGTVPGTDGNACFQRPVLHDLIAEGRKIAGGAQHRTRAGLLHQGSVRLVGADHLPWADALRRFLPASLALRCDHRLPSAVEIAQAEQLAAAKYATPSWTDRL